MPSLTLTAEFSLFADDTVLGPRFTLSGFEFVDQGGDASSVNESDIEKGLQFDKAGVRVTLPAETNLVVVRAAAFAGPFRVAAMDKDGNVLYPVTIPGDNTAHDVQLTHPGIALIDFAGGGTRRPDNKIWIAGRAAGPAILCSRGPAGAAEPLG
jgi:hypothetical protein